MSRSRAFWATLALGIGLIAAPAVFQMFERAPLGGEMIDEFAPYMTERQLGDFRGYMDQIEAANAETTSLITPADTPPAVVSLHDAWPTIDEDMGGMLAVMQANIGNFSAVAALPPFGLFPWFFVAPGVIVIGLSLWLRRKPGRAPGIAVALMGVGLIAAPFAFQMFERAPKGGDMITELGPYMTSERVAAIQGYFVTLGGAEGALRNQVLTNPSANQLTPLPGTESFVETWPLIAKEMAPMIGVMADNLDNFAAVDALPPFPLFPWFFVIPGALLVAAGFVAARRAPPSESTS